MTPVVRPVTRRDIPVFARTLADAFFDDPVMMWMWPDDERRRRGLPRMFAAEAQHHLLSHGGLELAEEPDGSAGGATMWAPPGRWKATGWRSVLVTAGMIRALGRRARVGAEVGGALDEAHPAEPHWYLSAIGTGNAARGGGFGKALLRSRLDRCDADGMPAYLESSKEKNISYYERFGFRVTGEIAVPNGGPTLWKMWREPVTR
ncbi:hypothetical protein Rruber_01690 [Rhodococcus ruber]|uniref:GNAT family N-acetyltransferase n=1 Tax=Rhodococcus ruber TaxID=1830 RepID=UPI00315DD9B3